MSLKRLRFLASIALVFALLVVMLGAYTRLTNAGLGCPDWPGCYGQMVLPIAQEGRDIAQHRYPNVQLESGKAWTEMVHRYAAGTLALLIVTLVLMAFQRRLSRGLSMSLVVLLIFQAALGMWTVTLKLLPLVVMAHLLGGMLIFSCLCCFRLSLSSVESFYLPHWRPWISLAVMLVFLQIALGGWVSSNYAGVACVGFPKCYGHWIPSLHFSEGFHLLSPVGANYQGGLLDSDARMTIQWVHRLGALITVTYIGALGSILLCCVKIPALRWLAGLSLFFVVSQFLLGVANVVFLLPLGIAVLHNGVAGLLLATVFMMRYLVAGGKTYASHN